MAKFMEGDRVSKVTGDYKFDGVVLAKFYKLSGLMRYVVEDDRGCVHIFNESQLDWPESLKEINELKAENARLQSVLARVGVQVEEMLCDSASQRYCAADDETRL